MIKHIKLLRNIGKFDSVDAGQHLEFKRLNLIYGDNGRGKTTLTAVLRSLRDGNPNPIEERKRVDSTHEPHVVIETDDSSSHLVYQSGAWSDTLETLAVFDDEFVEQNVHSGLSVRSQQRQNLHDIVLGPEGVALSKQLDELVALIESHNQELRAKLDAIPTWARGPYAVDEFCALTSVPNIDNEIVKAELRLAAARDRDSIAITPALDLLDLPTVDVEQIEKILQMDLETLQTDALEQLQFHFQRLGNGGEKWVSDGMQRIVQADNDSSSLICPFCAQPMETSSLIQHYQAYFSEVYGQFKRSISDTLTEINSAHNDNARIEFESRARVLDERQQFWIRFCQFDQISLETSELFKVWRNAWNAIAELVTAKLSSPLEKIPVPSETRWLLAEYKGRVREIEKLNENLKNTNQLIAEVKEQSFQASVQEISEELNQLKAIRDRHLPDVATACADYLQELDLKTKAEGERDRTRQELNSHRQNSFPQYQEKVNAYLERFGAGFSLKLRHENIRSGSTSSYHAQIGDTLIEAVRANPGPGEPHFGSVFSAGDRATLALVFFLASLDQNPDLGNTIVVIDDPVSSMDADRLLTTIQKIRELSSSAAQIILLSHNKPFLCRTWEHSSVESTSLEIARYQGGSTLREWNVREDSLTEHDRCHRKLEEYLSNNTGAQRDVAQSIRLYLEGFLRVACPQDFPPGCFLGRQFISECHTRLASSTPILSATKIQELSEILEYASKFHHDTNPQWATEQISDGELHIFVKRTLEFTRI